MLYLGVALISKHVALSAWAARCSRSTSRLARARRHLRAGSIKSLNADVPMHAVPFSSPYKLLGARVALCHLDVDG